MEALYDLCDMLDDEVKAIVQKGDISPNELDHMYKVVDIIKDIKTVDAMENSDYSYDSSYDSYDGNSNRGRRGRDGDGDGRYSERYSSRRGRDAMGRYTSRDNGGSHNYSRADDKEQMLQKIAEMKRQIEQMS